MAIAKRKKQREFVQPDASSDVIVTVGLQAEGATYSLHPQSAARIREAFPGVPSAPVVYLGYTTKGDFEQVHGPLWPQVLTLLTGVGLDRLRQLGRVILWRPQTDAITAVG
jgi:hypothetical protein